MPETSILLGLSEELRATIARTAELEDVPLNTWLLRVIRRELQAREMAAQIPAGPTGLPDHLRSACCDG